MARAAALALYKKALRASSAWPRSLAAGDDARIAGIRATLRENVRSAFRLHRAAPPARARNLIRGGEHAVGMFDSLGSVPEERMRELIDVGLSSQRK